MTCGACSHRSSRHIQDAFGRNVCTGQTFGRPCACSGWTPKRDPLPSAEEWLERVRGIRSGLIIERELTPPGEHLATIEWLLEASAYKPAKLAKDGAGRAVLEARRA